MLLRALVFYLAIFPVCADTEVIEYLIPEEVMGVYQSWGPRDFASIYCKNL